MTQKTIKILALDTVFEQCSVALLSNDTLIAENTILGNRGQTEIILSMIDELLTSNNTKLNEINMLAFNRGPGAFSGIRINTAVVQALSFACDIPCVGISSLKVLANAFFDTAFELNQVLEDEILASCIDARQNEVYACFYQIKNKQLIQIDDEKLLPYGSKIKADFSFGNGVAFIETNGRKVDLENPSAYHIGRDAYFEFIKNGGVSAENALPVYLRHNAWKTLAEQGKNK